MRSLIACLLLLVALPGQAALNVLACEPEWASLAQELGGDRVSVSSATTARQDPHRIEARPALIARARNADLLICTGAELESGWLPPLLTQAGNARIQPGRPGYFEASSLVTKLEIPRELDRAAGDVHASGNPHVHLDPRNIGKIAAALSARLADVDAQQAAYYHVRAEDFARRWQAALERWEAKAAPLRGVPVVVYHRDLSYFMQWTGMREAGSLEPKPGLPPTPGHLAELVERVKRERARAVVYSAYNDPAAALFLSRRAGVVPVMLPFTVGGTDRAKDLFSLFDDSLDRLLGALK